MKEIVKISQRGERLKTKDFVMGLGLHFLIFVFAFAASKGVVWDKLLPFGISFVAGCPLSFTPACALGVLVGYFIPVGERVAFGHLAIVFAVMAIKLLLSGYKKLVKSEIFLMFIAFITTLFTLSATLKIMGGSMVWVLSEAVLAAVGTYFTSKGFKAGAKCGAGLSPDELSNLLIIINILLLGVMRATVFSVSLGRILSVILILTASKYGGIIAGAVSGISVAFTLSLSGTAGNISIAFAVAGLFCAVFASLGKYAQVFVLVILSFIGAVSTKDMAAIPIFITETVLGAIVFLILPRSVGITLGKLFSAQTKAASPTGFKNALNMRLLLASNALRDVSETVEQVSRELSKINAPNFSGIIGLIEQDACTGCKLRIHCWEKKRQETVEAILQMTKAVKTGESNPALASPCEFEGRCLKIGAVSQAVCKRYGEYAAKTAAENRIDEVRTVVSDQFDGISTMLMELANDFEREERFDNAAAQNAAAVLKNIDLHTEEYSGRIDKYGRLTVELKLKKTPELVINKARVMQLCSLACERDFEIPTVSQVGGDFYITLNEKAKIAVDFGTAQSSARENTMCGDAYKAFTDSKGHFVMILSDGMGTGGRAAVDGAMASGLMTKLLKAGFGYDCALKILNSSMLFKSTDESLATVDIASIDLYTGATELYKAGAAPTIVLRSGKTGKAESNSLPVGILRNVGFDRALIRCRVGDMVVLLSDGATSDGTDWIRMEIEAWQDGSAQDLAEHLCLCAKRRQNQKRQDDITVMCAILNNA
ncbi:MAG: SpoIIE family protein phosphatase [Clostridia bacterium]|nr:SpoIIE family protein phosphatase [Clostridia bacterium]